jgi:hypothetical protein
MSIYTSAKVTYLHGFLNENLPPAVVGPLFNPIRNRKSAVSIPNVDVNCAVSSDIFVKHSYANRAIVTA